MKAIRAIRARVALLTFKIQAFFLLFGIPREAIVATFYAVAVGFNEMARMQVDIRRKAMCRMMRSATQRSMIELGIIQEELPFLGNPVVLVIEVRRGVPPIEFRESDWELMRAALKRHDEAKGCAS